MIKKNTSNKNKDWTVGSLVNVGFMKNLKVISVESLEYGMPNVYLLESQSGKKYEFIPHNGLHAL